jgi:hypothetical protein
MTEEELKYIEERCNNATKGPWRSLIENRDHEAGDSFIMTGIETGGDIWSDRRGEDIYIIGGTLADQDFIASAKQDIPRLIEEVRNLKKALNKFIG